MKAFKIYLMINIVNLITYFLNTGSVGTLTSSSGGTNTATAGQHTMDQKAEAAKKEGKLWMVSL